MLSEEVRADRIEKEISEVLENKRRWAVTQADCVEFMRRLPERSVSLVVGSPPYMDARTYGINAQRDCAEWVDWMLTVTEAAIHASDGLVVWVVSGVQRDNCYWPGCEGLMYLWWQRGNHLWRPCIWHKVDAKGGGTGIPGSGGKQWLRADWEYCLAFKREGWLPWADNTALGTPPKFRPGGPMSNRTVDGCRVNVWHRGKARIGGRRANGKKQSEENPAGSACLVPNTKRQKNGEMQRQSYAEPDLCNPGNFLVRARVGGGHIGSDLAHESEAPYPETVPEFFIRGWAPPDSVVCDPFSGSGTTLKVALMHDRRFVGCDLRESQVSLSKRRAQEVEPWKKDESLPSEPLPLFGDL